MGISGLLQVLRDVMDPVSVETLRGQTAAIDAFSWLHKGVYACSTELCLGQKTSKHIKYVMGKVDMLLAVGVTPYVVFDGDYLPMKAGKEDERAASRQKNLERGLAYLQDGNSRAAHNCFVKAVDVTPEMAFEVIKILRARNIKYIVAPYEADAQLAWLCQNGHADFVISEDSDCIPFGCKKVLFKMDRAGNGLLYHARNLSSCEKLDFLNWTHDMLLDMCILAGCDYLPSIKGMGVVKAHALIAKYKSPARVFKALRFTGGMRVPPGYEARFREARLTFLHQRCFDPGGNVLCTLKPLPAGAGAGAGAGGDRAARAPAAKAAAAGLPTSLSFLGPVVDNRVAREVAEGRVHPTTKVEFASRDDGTGSPQPSEAEAARAAMIQEAMQAAEEAAKKKKGPATQAQVQAFFAPAAGGKKKKQLLQHHHHKHKHGTHRQQQQQRRRRPQQGIAGPTPTPKRAPGAVIGARALVSYALTNTKRVSAHQFKAPRAMGGVSVTTTSSSTITTTAAATTTTVWLSSSRTAAAAAAAISPASSSSASSSSVSTPSCASSSPASCASSGSASSSSASSCSSESRGKRKLGRSKYFAQPSGGRASSGGGGGARGGAQSSTHAQAVLRRAESNLENLADAGSATTASCDSRGNSSSASGSKFVHGDNFYVLDSPDTATSLKPRGGLASRATGAIKVLLDRFSYGGGAGDDGDGDRERVVGPAVALGPPQTKRPRGVKGLKQTKQKQQSSAWSSSLPGTCTWNEFQQMHRGSQVTTAEWRAFQRQQHQAGGAPPAGPGGRPRHSGSGGFGGGSSSGARVLVAESPDVGVGGRSRGRLASAGSASGTAFGAASNLFKQFLCSMSSPSH